MAKPARRYWLPLPTASRTFCEVLGARSVTEFNYRLLAAPKPMSLLVELSHKRKPPASLSVISNAPVSGG